ncbi:type II secretion system protein [Lujinxingia vulgaris]|uniref:Type II secretion system protein n=1 Tax=Lujinxingia vulgaris TaxID=2600176 RepID=A0A5C6WZ17_9DELT|nr:type II secretion system protein [Lujinxingia vulgaris]TXD34693.1 type II secretion system protein [Lujinxingia vulgaris]
MIKSWRTPQEAGFTLVELLIALAILASTLTILMGTVSQSGQQSIYASRLTNASLLARSKMTDLEYVLMEEGFSVSDRAFSGDFSDEGYPEIRWEATVEPVEIPPEIEDEFMAQVNSQLFGGTDQQQGAMQGNAAFSAALPMLMAQIPVFVNQVGERVRRINLKVYFDYMGREQHVEVAQYVVDLEDNDFQMFGTPDEFSLDEGGR